jgi:hypothetical protein
LHPVAPDETEPDRHPCVAQSEEGFARSDEREANDVNTRTHTEQELRTRLGQVRAGIEKLEYEKQSKQAVDETSDATVMKPIRSRLTMVETELDRLHAADDDVWDKMREGVQTMLEALANDVDRQMPHIEHT